MSEVELHVISNIEQENSLPVKKRAKILYNRSNPDDLKKQLYQEVEPRITISFYQYFVIDNPQQFRDELYVNLEELHVFGRIYVAHEGINAQASVPVSKFESFKNYLHSISGLDGLRINVAVDDDGKSFWVLKIKVRAKIVADGITDLTFDMSKRGSYVTAEEFNHITNDPETIVVDMRNHYEYEVGHFNNAIEIPSDTFREQLPMVVEMLKDKKDKNIVMYCTGGIRCEKASSWMLHNGFKHVSHLEGGIIHYANNVKIKDLDNKFLGKNFVFDNRLGERIGNEIISMCHQCGVPSDNHVNCANNGCHLLFLQCEECNSIYDGCCSKACQEALHLPVEAQKESRKGVFNGQNIFNKSRLRPKLG